MRFIETEETESRTVVCASACASASSSAFADSTDALSAFAEEDNTIGGDDDS